VVPSTPQPSTQSGDTHYYIQAVDAKSFFDLCRRNPSAIASAVQRSAGVIAIGPVLQGLKFPVNDLSRGCTVPDVVNTVVITAIQAQADKGLL
jgi:hypothetical protein